MSDSNKVYRHVQIGYTVLAAMLVGLLIVGIILRSFNHQVPHGLPRTISLALLSAVALFLVACLVVFSSLTIVVSDAALTWYFTGHVLGGTVPLREIERVTREQNPAAYGWGIRLLPDGRLYNVSGFKAVRIALRGGRRYVLGSDEPDRLVEAIEAGLQ